MEALATLVAIVALVTGVWHINSNYEKRREACEASGGELVERESRTICARVQKIQGK